MTIVIDGAREGPVNSMHGGGRSLSGIKHPELADMCCAFGWDSGGGTSWVSVTIVMTRIDEEVERRGRSV